MRTIITLDPHTAALVSKHMRRRAVNFQQLVNEALHEATGARGERRPFSTPSVDMGAPAVLDRALALAADLHDEGLLRK